MCFSRATDGASFLTATCQTIGKGEQHCQWPAANVKRQADPSCSLSNFFFSLTPSSFDFCLFKILSASHENHLYREYFNCAIFYVTLKYMKYLNCSDTLARLCQEICRFCAIWFISNCTAGFKSCNKLRSKIPIFYT